MTTKNKILISVLVSILLLAFIFWPKPKPEELGEILPPDEGEGGDNSGIVTPPDIKYATDQFPLKKGSTGQFVTWLQKAINLYVEKVRKQKAPLVADGKFGPLTEKWLKDIYKVTTVSRTLYSEIAKHVGLLNGNTFTGFIN